MRVSVVPFFSPVLFDPVVRVVCLAPALALLEAASQLDLPFVTPLFTVGYRVLFTPFLMPLLPGGQVLASLLARAFFNFF